MPFSSGERILVFLHTSRPPDGIVGGFDQVMISDACSIGRTHVPRSMKPLLEQGLVVEDKGRAPGRSRRVKRYALTQLGQEAAAVILARVRSSRISISGPDGVKHSGDPLSVLSIANSFLGSRSERPLTLSLLLSAEGTHIPWEKLSELSKSIPDSSDRIPLPDGWKGMRPPMAQPDLIAREEENTLLSLLSENDVIVLQGSPGSGRKTLLTRVLAKQGLMPAWIMRCPPGERGDIPVDVDILVVMDGPLSVRDMIMDVQDVRDPRDGSWDDELRSLPLVLIREGEIDDPELPTVTVSGLDEKDFMQYLASMDIPDWTSIAIYRAARGSPLAVTVLRVMDSQELDELSSLPADEAVFKVLMLMGRVKDVSKD